jgi:hypothetical protein
VRIASWHSGLRDRVVPILIPIFPPSATPFPPPRWFAGGVRWIEFDDILAHDELIDRCVDLAMVIALAFAVLADLAVR